MRWTYPFCALAVSLFALPAHAEILSAPPLTLDGSIALREMYDSNVMLQSEGSLANRASPVTLITPTLSLTAKNPFGLNTTLKLDYSPSFTFIHNRPEESHTDHVASLKIFGGVDRWSYDAATSLLAVDGAHTSFLFFSPDGAPALGAPSLRDRRDQLLFRGNYKIQYTADTWFARSVASLYAVDYHIDQRNQSGYCNFVNRSDYNAGLDLGYLVLPKLFAVIGYRYGYQDQGTVLSGSTQASNTYNRVLFGAEGNPLPWLKFNFLAGPDFRDFTDHAPVALNDRTRFYLEAAATATFSPSDELTLAAKRWTLPASGGTTVYDDSSYELAWKHVFTSQLVARAAVKVCGGEWEAVHRDDWVYAARVGAEYKFDKHWSADAGYQLELGRSADRSLDGRDYDRHLLWLGVKFDF